VTLLAALSVLVAAVTWLDGRASAREQIDLARQADVRDQADRQREEAQRAAEAAAESGVPVRVSAGYGSWPGPSGYVAAEALPDLDGQPWDPYAPADAPGYEWLRGGPIDWVPTSVWVAEIVVEATSSGTVLVQGIEVRDRTCAEPLDGTFLGMPRMGGPGQDAPPVLLGVDVQEPRPVTRERDESKTLGDPWTSQLALEKGDSRAISVLFVAETQHCTFEADLVVHSRGVTHRVPFPAREDGSGGPGGATFEISGQAAAHQNAYHVAVDGSTVIQTLPPRDVAGYFTLD